VATSTYSEVVGAKYWSKCFEIKEEEWPAACLRGFSVKSIIVRCERRGTSEQDELTESEGL
jgi:hypothetical protein